MQTREAGGRNLRMPTAALAVTVLRVAASNDEQLPFGVVFPCSADGLVEPAPPCVIRRLEKLGHIFGVCLARRPGAVSPLHLDPLSASQTQLAASTEAVPDFKALQITLGRRESVGRDELKSRHTFLCNAGLAE